MIDYKKTFNNLPGNYIILAPDAPHFTVLAVNDAYLKSTEVKREDILGKPLFTAYPENPNGSGSGPATGQDKVKKSLLKVLETKERDEVGIVRYDIRVNCTREFDTKYWSPTHVPILDDNGEVQYIIESALDITQLVLLGLQIPDQQ